MSLRRFTRKTVVTAAVDAPVHEVAEKMLRHHVGAVVICEGARPIGIITDRDLALRVVATRVSSETPAREVMSTDLISAHADEEMDAVIFRMRQHGVRRVPILSADGTLVGIVALDDLMVMFAGELSSTADTVLDNRGP
jgi:CBS domain-containing protein